MDIIIRLGTEKDIDGIETLYQNATDYLEVNTNYAGWKKDFYPLRQDGLKGIINKNLFVAMKEKEIVGSIILRPQDEQVYATAPWQALLKENQVLVIHTFVVDPKYLQQNIGKQMLDFASEYSSINKIKALRLDVSEHNYPAIKLYEKCGYQYIKTVSLGLESIGLDWFHLYEKLH